MLIITKAQMDRLDSIHLEGFKARLAAHLRALFPAVTHWSDEEMAAEIDSSITEARSHGFKSERDVARYVDLRTQLGTGFAAEPSRQWIAAVFSDPEVLPELKMDAIFEELEARVPDCGFIAAWWRENG